MLADIFNLGAAFYKSCMSLLKNTQSLKLKIIALLFLKESYYVQCTQQIYIFFKKISVKHTFDILTSLY